MPNVLAFSILTLTIGLSLKRPSIGQLRMHHAHAAVIGAVLAVLTGVVPLSGVAVAASVLCLLILTIVSFMIITLIAEQIALFEILPHRIAGAATGDGRKRFAYLFFAGTITVMFFTNDAAVLIFTPLVFNLIEDVQGESWTVAQKLPFYFAVLYVANLVGGLVISNPINIILSSFFKVGFLEYAAWMIGPALVSVAVSYLGLRLAFRRSIPRTYAVQRSGLARAHGRLLIPCAIILALVLASLFSESITHVPTWAVALAGALVLLALHTTIGRAGIGPVLAGVGWDVLIFVFGIFIVSMGLRNVGLAEVVGKMISATAGGDLHQLMLVAGLVAATSSAIMNYHPTADMMAFVIQAMRLPELETKLLVYAALVGGDLGPKMLPMGSLAALMWFRILRNKGVHVPYWLYIKTGVPVTLAAAVLSILTLSIEVAAFGLLGGPTSGR